MGKKYTPSGYQIIDIDDTGLSLGDAFTPRTEDEKILLEILKSLSDGKTAFKKPILITYYFNSASHYLCGFASQYEGTIQLVISDGVEITFAKAPTDNEKLVITVVY